VKQQNPAIRISGLHKSYQQLHVLKGVDLEVARGSIRRQSRSFAG
jgi:ABC-2 type transport system ATP-binding protein